MVECIEFDPAQPDHVFASTGGEGARYIKLDRGEIFHSVNRGDSWEKLPLTFPLIYALAVALAYPVPIPAQHADNSRVISITGSDSGIGLAITRKFAMEGYRIAM